LNKKVTKIITQDNKIKSVIDDGQKEYIADYYFSSMPVRDLINSLDDKNENVREVADGLGYRSFITVGLLVKIIIPKPEKGTIIKSYKNRVSDQWIYIQEREVKLGRLQIFNNWSPYLINDYENTVWLGLEYFCDENDSMWNMPEKEFIKFASKELEQIGIIKMSSVLDSCLVKVPKAYPGYFGTYKKFDVIKNFIDNMKTCFWSAETVCINIIIWIILC
jgi:protoporphyrinogen oxidase